MTLKDSATLAGGFNDTGTITFKLYAPDGVTVVDTESVIVNGNGTYVTPVGYVPQTVGVFNWVASYSGDPNNAKVTSGFGDEPVTIVLPPGLVSKRYFLSDAADPLVVAAPIVVAAIMIDGGPTGPITESMPTFTWNALGGANHYDLWVDDITTGQSQIVRNQNIAATSYASTVNLSLGHTYHWWVRGFSAAGIGGPWSQALGFNIVPLPAPTSVAPGGQTNNLLPTFTWNAVAGADHYDLWVDDATAGTSQVMRVQNALGTSFTTAAPLTVGHSYRWWVRAITNRGTPGLWSQGATFSEAIVGTPAPLGPKANVGADASFTWTAAVGADHYDLWVNDNSSGQGQALRNQTITGTSWQPPHPLKIGDTYRWWVRALSSTGAAGAWSSAVDFTVLAFPPPILVGITGPAASPVFNWSAVPHADHYDLWVDDVTTGQSQVVCAPHVVGNSYMAAPLTQGHTYQWWVRVFDTSGVASLWSDAAIFALA